MSVVAEKTPKKMLRGGKINSTSSTVIAGAQQLILFLNRHDAVTKIVLGRIAHVGGGNRRVQLDAVQVGLRLVVRDKGGRQEFFIHTARPDEVRADIASIADKKKR